MPGLHVPTYPVVHPDPSYKWIFYNFNSQDYLAIAGFSAAGYTWGWFKSRKLLRTSNARFLLGIGLLAGTMYATLGSAQRLMGLEPNAWEVQRYGVMSEKDLKDFETRSRIPNIELIDSGDKKH